jgi:hypothetical protein
LKNKSCLVFAAATLLATSITSGHHSVSVEFDTSKSVAIRGTVCSIQASNPHSYLYVYARLSNGQTETWKLELPAPNRFGFPSTVQGKDLLKAGEAIAIQANPSRTPSTPSVGASLIYSACPSQPANSLQSGYAREITLSDGKQVRISEEQPATVSVRFF